jgi:hypothetical protein
MRLAVCAAGHQNAELGQSSSLSPRRHGVLRMNRLAPDDRAQTKAGAWDLKGGNVLELRPDNGEGAALSTFLIEQAHPEAG